MLCNASPRVTCIRYRTIHKLFLWMKHVNILEIRIKWVEMFHFTFSFSNVLLILLVVSLKQNKNKKQKVI